MNRKHYENAIPASDRAARRNALVADRLRTKGAILAASLVLPEYEEEKYLTLGLGNNTLCGRVYKMPGLTWASIDNFEVNRQLRGRGIGERLLKAFVVEVKESGATVLWSNGVSNAALALRRKVFGDDNLEFYDCQKSQCGFLPITVDQAIATNMRIDQLDFEDPERRNPEGHLGICVDLEQIDTTEWEKQSILTYVQ